jgi:hypothetical protein
MDRIDAIMFMRREPSFRLSCSDPHKAACAGKRRHGKTGISRGPHLGLVSSVIHQVTATLRLPLSTGFGNAKFWKNNDSPVSPLFCGLGRDPRKALV